MANRRANAGPLGSLCLNTDGWVRLTFDAPLTFLQGFRAHDERLTVLCSSLC